MKQYKDAPTNEESFQARIPKVVRPCLGEGGNRKAPTIGSGTGDPKLRWIAKDAYKYLEYGREPPTSRARVDFASCSALSGSPGRKEAATGESLVELPLTAMHGAPAAPSQPGAAGPRTRSEPPSRRRRRHYSAVLPPPGLKKARVVSPDTSQTGVPETGHAATTAEKGRRGTRA